MHLAQPDYLGYASHLKIVNVIIPAKSLLPCKVAYSQVLGIRTWTSEERWGDYSAHSARASNCGGFSCCRAPALGVQASVVVARRLSSCGARA